jgi:phosphoglycerate dehydrogenase-like enzyme
MLALARQIPANDRRVRQGDWAAPATRSMAGLTLGVLGLGNIGQAMARMCQALDMHVIAWSPTLTPERAARSGAESVSFDDLFRRSDVLFVSARMSEQTRGLVGANQLAMLKPTSYLVNIARGPIVDEDALLEALQERRIGGAGLDVFDMEPLPAAHPLTALDNVVLTPHIGWGVQSNFARFVENTVDAIEKYLDGDTSHVVNPAALANRVAARS